MMGRHKGTTPCSAAERGHSRASREAPPTHLGPEMLLALRGALHSAVMSGLHTSRQDLAPDARWYPRCLGGEQQSQRRWEQLCSFVPRGLLPCPASSCLMLFWRTSRSSSGSRGRLR
jgi:hypothetical protein